MGSTEKPIGSSSTHTQTGWKAYMVQAVFFPAALPRSEPARVHPTPHVWYACCLLNFAIPNPSFALHDCPTVFLIKDKVEGHFCSSRVWPSFLARTASCFFLVNWTRCQRKKKVPCAANPQYILSCSSARSAAPRVNFERNHNGKPPPGTCFGDAAWRYLSIPDNAFGWAGVVLRLRNTIRRRSRCSPSSALVYQVARRP